MRKSNTKIILIISSLSLAIVVFAFIYLLQVIKNKSKHVSAVNMTLQNKITDKDNINFSKERISELEDIQKRIDSYLIDASNADVFVSFLENIGVQNNVELSVKEVNVLKDEKNKISMNLNLNGSFSDVTKVIYILENAPYSIKINSLYLNKDTEQNPKVTVNTKLSKLTPRESSWQANINMTVLSF